MPQFYREHGDPTPNDAIHFIRQHCGAVPGVTLCCCRLHDDRVPIFTVSAVTQLPVMLCTFLQAIGTVTQFQMTPHFDRQLGDPIPGDDPFL